MPTPILFVACEKAVVNIFRNDLSVIGFMDQVYPLAQKEEDPKYLISPFYLVSVWRADEVQVNTIEQKVILISPDGKELEIAHPIQTAVKGLHTRVVQETNIITARLLGPYQTVLHCRFDQSEEWHEAARHTFVLMEFVFTPPSDEQQQISEFEESASATEED